MKRTIFITSCHPLISRNILSTGVLEMLLKAGFEIVLIVPDSKKEFFLRSFGQAGVTVEGISYASTKRDGLMKYLSLASLSTRTLSIKRQTEMKGSGSFSHFILSNRLAHSTIRFLEKISYKKDLFSDLFNKYQPDKVFCTDIQNEIDIALLNEAHRKGIYSFGMVRSWDNLTSKGLIRSIPQKLIVWNNIIKKEATLLNAVPDSAIAAVGIPHYDSYKKCDFSDKASFFKKIGGDPEKKMALFIPIGDRYLTKNNVDADVVALLDSVLPADYQILVRFPPGDYVRGIENNPGRFDKSRVLYDRIAMTSDSIKMTEIRKDDDIHLAQTLHWSDIVISGPSTLVIDAAYMDRPLILSGFDGTETKPYLDSIRRYYDYDNFIPILESGGAKLAKSSDEFVSYVKEYLADPKKDVKGRKNLAEKQGALDDEMSTKRLFDELMTAFK